MSALYVALLAYVASEACNRFGFSRPLRRLVLLTVFCLPLAAELHQFLTEPTIFFFNHAWGWYAGSIYDEGLIPDGRLGFFRLGTLIRSLALVVALQMLRKLTIRAAPLITLVIAIAWFGESRLAIEEGYYVDRDQIETILSERVELDGLVLHLDPSISKKRRQRIVVEHAYRLEQLEHLYQGLESQDPIHSYVYRDAEQKGALMGGKRTMFAKPWLREIHIHGYRVPHRILGHELVHALLEPHADHPLGIPVANGVIPLMAWVEGFAEAFTPPRSAYDIHTNARWLQERGRLPPLQPLLSPWTFWRTSPGVAYPVMGSFIDFLFQHYGDQTLVAYRDGNIEEALGESVETLEAKWHLFLEKIELDEVTQRGAARRLRKPSLFDRPCARVIAALREEAGTLPDEQAPRVYREICDLLPGDPRALFDHAQSLAKAGDWNAFEKVVEKLDAEATLTDAQLGNLLALQGEQAWKLSQRPEAHAYFNRALALHTGNATSRLRWVATKLLAEPMSSELSTQWYRYLFEKMPLENALILFQASQEANIDSDVLGYLHGRRLYAASRWDESRVKLLDSSLKEGFMEAERLRLVREVYFELKQYEAADAYHQRYLKHLSSSGERARAADAWGSRLFAKKQRSSTTD